MKSIPYPLQRAGRGLPVLPALRGGFRWFWRALLGSLLLLAAPALQAAEHPAAPGAPARVAAPSLSHYLAGTPWAATDPLIVTSTYTNISCFGGSNGTVTVTIAGGTAPYTLSWTSSTSPGPHIQTVAAPGTVFITGLIQDRYYFTVTDANGNVGTCSDYVPQPAAYRTTFVIVGVGCSGSATGSITMSVRGATAPFTYLWSNGAMTKDLNGVPAGTYTVVITDVLGCVGTASATVPAATTIAAVVSKTDAACGGSNTGSIALAVSGGTAPYTYLWSNGATTQNLSGLGAGTYTVTVTDAGGCTGIGTATVLEPPVLRTIVAVTRPSCFGGATGGAAAAPSGGTAPYSYLWSNGATTAALTNVAGGSYTVTITDASGCTATGTANITESTQLTAAATPTDVDCYSATNGSISLAVSGGTTPFTFLWSNGSTTQNLSGLAPGSYSVTVTDANGCTAQCGGTVGRPTQLLAISRTMDVSCFDTANGSVDLSVSGGTAPYSYLWSNGATTQDLVALMGGTYSVAVTDAHGCTATATAVINRPALLQASALATPTSCTGSATGAVALSVSGGTAPFGYQWSNGATSQNLGGVAAGTYSVVVTDANGCTASARATVDQPATLTALASKTDASCTGSSGSITLTVSGGTAPYSYVWSNGANTQNLSNLGAGTYTVVVTDAQSCTASCGATISQPIAMRTSTTVTAASCCLSSSGSIDLTVSGGTAPFSYLWSNGTITQDLSNVPAGTYSVTITDASGCMATASATITQPAALHASTSSTNATCAGSDGTATVTASGGTAPYYYSWSPGGQSTATATGLAAGSYTVTITDGRGCTLTVSAAVMAANCRAQHCTLPHGGYGNGNGVICKEPAKRRLELIADMFTSANLVLGAPGRSLTYSYAGGSSSAAALARQATAQCIIDKMPAGGPAAAFPSTLGNASGCASSFPTNFLKNGRFGNVLVGQTLALALNLRLDNTLGGVPLSATMTSYATLSCSLPDPRDLTGISRSIPASVLGNLSYLGGPPTVGGLLVLANKALGGVAYANGGGNPSASDIACAVGALNELFDECRMFGASQAVRGLAAGPAAMAPANRLNSLPTDDDNNLSAYPNPFTTATTLTFALPLAAKYSLVVYDLKGSEVARVSSGLAEAGVRYRFAVGTGLQEGVYVARLFTTNGTQTIRLNVLH